SPRPGTTPRGVSFRGGAAVLGFIVRRILYMVPTLAVISMVTFLIIQLPPGDYMTTVLAGLSDNNVAIDDTAVQAIRERYGLGQPFLVQYWKWISNIVLHGDFGQSFEWN